MITEIIDDLVSIWGISPYDINCGECDEFAQTTIECLGGYSDNLYELVTGNFDPEMNTDLPGHMWIFYKGRHYDSESPYGVDDWRQLPIFTKYQTE